MSTAIKSLKRNKQLPAHSHSVSSEIYSAVARFPCDSTTFLFAMLRQSVPAFSRRVQLVATTEHASENSLGLNSSIRSRVRILHADDMR